MSFSSHIKSQNTISLQSLKVSAQAIAHIGSPLQVGPLHPTPTSGEAGTHPWRRASLPWVLLLLHCLFHSLAAASRRIKGTENHYNAMESTVAPPLVIMLLVFPSETNWAELSHCKSPNTRKLNNIYKLTRSKKK